MKPFDSFIKDFRHHKILIFGLGLQGRGVGDAQLFHQIGCQVRITDLKSEIELRSSLQELPLNDIHLTLGSHQRADIDWADVIIRNASVPWHHPLLDLARQQHKPIYMDTQLFVKYAHIPTIGVTGTRGKTTTATLIYQLLKKHSTHHVILGGNIRHVATLPLLKTIKSNSLAVLELSSWQLQAFDQYHLSPQIAVVTNIYPDHLNTYSSMSEYVKDKQAIIKYQTSRHHAILNCHLPNLNTWQKITKASVHLFDSADVKAISTPLQGDHNLENIAAAVQVAHLLHLSVNAINHTLATFQPLEYRLQPVAEYRGVTFINDTTSTTPVATIAALNTIPDPILILGGSDKQLPVQELISQVNQKAKQIILIPGSGTDRIRHHLDPQKILAESSNMLEIVALVLKHTKSGDTILLSPGFTSFGLFTNEFDRGEKFNQAVAQLTHEV